MSVKSTLAAVTTAAALIATPALAADAPSTTPAHGKATAPGQLCKGQSHKKTMKGKGKSPFAACVLGAKRAQREADEQQSTTDPQQSTTATSPAKLCKDQSKKKSSKDRKSPFAACVSGAAKAQDQAEQTETQKTQQG